MVPSGLYRVDGYVPTGTGHWAAKLAPLPRNVVLRPNRTEGTTLWSSYQDEGKEGLQRALLCPDNAALLRRLAECPNGEVSWTVGSFGAAAEVDAMALLTEPSKEGGTLLLVDGEPVGATKPSRLRAQYVRAMRGARGALAGVRLTEPAPKITLAVLAAWRPSIERPSVAHPPGWRGDAVPRPAIWGYLPFCHDGTEHVLFGRWVNLDANRFARQVEERCRRWLSRERRTLAESSRPLRRIEFHLDLGKGSLLVFLLDRGPFRARLCLPSSKHRRAMLAESREDYQVRRIRSLRDAAYRSRWAPTGWAFLGETVEQGSPWLTWAWTQADAPSRIDWVTANSEAERFAITMKMFIAGA